MDLRAAVDSVN